MRFSAGIPSLAASLQEATIASFANIKNIDIPDSPLTIQLSRTLKGRLHFPTIESSLGILSPPSSFYEYPLQFRAWVEPQVEVLLPLKASELTAASYVKLKIVPLVGDDLPRH